MTTEERLLARRTERLTWWLRAAWLPPALQRRRALIEVELMTKTTQNLHPVRIQGRGN